jgi:hypothetical protein
MASNSGHGGDPEWLEPPPSTFRKRVYIVNAAHSDTGNVGSGSLQQNQATRSASFAQALAVGITFNSWKHMKMVVIDYGMSIERGLVTMKKDSKMWKLKCFMNDVKHGENQCP